MTGIFVEVVNRSITAGWLVLAVAVLRLVLKNGPRWINLLLWGMVALRLLFPVSIESSFSLIPDASPLPGRIAGDAYRTESAFRENGAEGAEASYEDVEAGGRKSRAVYRKTGEYTCSMRLAELNVETEEDKVWIENGERYIGARAFGVEGGEEFILCLPGAPMEELDDDFVNWAPDYYLWRDGGIRNLSAYGLYNVKEGYGFFTNWH